MTVFPTNIMNKNCRFHLLNESGNFYEAEDERFAPSVNKIRKELGTEKRESFKIPASIYCSDAKFRFSTVSLTVTACGANSLPFTETVKTYVTPTATESKR